MAVFQFQVEGIHELRKSLNKLGSVPQKHVTYASRKGVNIILKAARKAAPKKSGELRRGIVLKGERARKKKGKKVYQIIFDPKKNDIFRKSIQNPGVRGGEKDTGYYPVSQEYGFSVAPGVKVEGKGFVHDSFNANVAPMKNTIIKELKAKIDQEIAQNKLK